MGELAVFDGGQGYLALPDHGRRTGPGVVVIQEWWGLNEQIRGFCDRLAAAGFAALAPDLYRGEITHEPDEAAKLMMGLNLEHAANDMLAAVRFLDGHPDVDGAGIGVVGFCMGGGLALYLATVAPDTLVACVPFYGVIPWPSAHPDWSRVRARVQGHYAQADTSAPPEAVRALEAELRAGGVDAEFFIYEGAEHAFTNEMRPEVYHEEHADLAIDRAIAFLHETLDAR
jgi:carboxymethylenebutenolidase